MNFVLSGRRSDHSQIHTSRCSFASHLFPSEGGTNGDRIFQGYPNDSFLGQSLQRISDFNRLRAGGHCKNQNAKYVLVSWSACVQEHSGKASPKSVQTAYLDDTVSGCVAKDSQV